MGSILRGQHAAVADMEVVSCAWHGQDGMTPPSTSLEILLGGGGFGTVYQCSQPNGQLNAVKLVRHGTEPAQVEGVQREARLGMRLSHDNLLHTQGFLTARTDHPALPGNQGTPTTSQANAGAASPEPVVQWKWTLSSARQAAMANAHRCSAALLSVVSSRVSSRGPAQLRGSMHMLETQQTQDQEQRQQAQQQPGAMQAPQSSSWLYTSPLDDLVLVLLERCGTGEQLSKEDGSPATSNPAASSSSARGSARQGSGATAASSLRRQVAGLASVGNRAVQRLYQQLPLQRALGGVDSMDGKRACAQAVAQKEQDHDGGLIDSFDMPQGRGFIPMLAPPSTTQAAHGAQGDAALTTAIYMDLARHGTLVEYVQPHTASTSQHLHLQPAPGANPHTPHSTEAVCALLARALHLLLGAARGLAHLHGQGLVHGDIKAANILVDDSPAADAGCSDTRPARAPARTSSAASQLSPVGAAGVHPPTSAAPAAASVNAGLGPVTAKLCDFGLAVQLPAGQTEVRGFGGTLTHMAPEVTLAQRISAACDVYAFGCAMWEAVEGAGRRHMYPGVARAHLHVHAALQGARPAWHTLAPWRHSCAGAATAAQGGCDTSAGDAGSRDAALAQLASQYIALAAACWEQDPEARPSALELTSRLEQLAALSQNLARA
mmetsp:Transcript_34455/g.87093  ORF Transcript_34455/g.87093 Transcript_34455/m.87093 type:complete len:663 (-) Transcript_34455:423-2411(-)|eukprot:CAMPEP_0202859046 /NCGR_PEP_ID=MMETSP1391-20130828/1332_1 /ASSEMBLY_ACC=CAM_ASM_000867 /TAXON_ID=1034604 /ORGANISM="Chlamydomonas leiostraca, Strain SAG 11-49" /LENGTH=662 /DNA_ID=CAMNT_0049538047 /DNA_START=217 /DNA_END=2208 /DNA_ORIENTATION=+